ncbi:MAG: opacity family porin [Pseudomonadota bacterium]
MTRNTLSFALCLSLMAGSAAPAFAADWNYGAGGLKGSVGTHGIPVPAPVPIPDYEPEWYLRGDIGYTLSSSGDVLSSFSRRALTPGSGEVELTGQTPAAIDFDDLNGQGVFSFGVGRYLTKSWRLEVTGERRLSQKIVNQDTRFQARIRDDSQAGTAMGGAEVEVFRDFFYDVNRGEQTDHGSYMLMANVIYDLEGRYGFKPYIGGGIGFSFQSINRDYDETVNCFEQIQTGDLATQVTTNTCTGDSATGTSGGEDAIGVGLGLAAMAGVGYEVRDGIHWDLGYRYVYQGTTLSVAAPTLNGTSTIEVEGRHDHEIRTGIRFDIQ